MTRRQNKLISRLLAVTIFLMVPMQLLASFSVHAGSVHGGSMHAGMVSKVAHKAHESCENSKQQASALPECNEHTVCDNDSCKTSTSCPSCNSVSRFRQSLISIYIQYFLDNAPYTASYVPDFSENPLLRPPISL